MFHKKRILFPAACLWALAPFHAAHAQSSGAEAETKTPVCLLYNGGAGVLTTYMQPFLAQFMTTVLPQYYAMVQPEACDDSIDNDCDGMINEDCGPYPEAVCPNGIVEEGEECDDGNSFNFDGCTNECKIRTHCGNGVVDGLEQCDDGNDIDGDGCSRRCRFETDIAPVGNGVLQVAGIEIQGEQGQQFIRISGSIVDYTPPQVLSLQGNLGRVSADGAFEIDYFVFGAVQDSVRLELLSDNAGTVLSTLDVDLSGVALGPETTRLTVAQGGEVSVQDSESPIRGAKITVPPNALKRDVDFYFDYDPQHVPNVPFEYVAVGNPVSLYPLGETLSEQGRLTIPVETSLFPPDTPISELRVLGWADDGWEVIEGPSADASSVSIGISDLRYGGFVAVMPRFLAPGQRIIASDPAYATIYIDGVDTGLRTPAIVSDVIQTRDVKLYLDGFNESFTQLEPSAGRFVQYELTTEQTDLPSITMEQDLASITSTTEALLELSGTVQYNGTILANQTVIVSHNGNDTFQRTDANGRFEGAIALRRGQNQLSLRTTGDNGQTYSTPVYNIALGSPDITVTLSWNTDGTDIDMHVFNPDDAHAWYGSLGGIPNGALDRDDTNGFGPEVFTLSNPKSGTYAVNVNSFAIASDRPTTATLEVRLGNSVIFNESYLFTASDNNAGEGRGTDSPSFWKAFEFNIGALEITRLDFPIASQPENAIFTTAQGENRVGVRYLKPEELADDALSLEVREIAENFLVPTQDAVFANEQVEFDLSHQTPSLLDFTRDESLPLTYDIQLQANESNLQSEIQRISQDTKSQLRQEYIDNREIRSGFSMATPERGNIIHAGQFTNPGNFSFNEFARHSDFGPGLAIIDQSAMIAQTVRAAWGQPIRITSAFRNPRRNARVGGVVNSGHQAGDAVDLNPTGAASTWPDRVICGDGRVIEVRNYRDAQMGLTCVAKLVLAARDGYYVGFHDDHLHIEYDPR